LTGSQADGDALEQELDFYAQKIREQLGALVFGMGTDRLEASIGRMLEEQGKMLVTAESCTGGYLAHLITSVPGSSNYFKGSIIAYSNEVKMKQLNVKPQTLETYGAVSEQTVAEMTRGAIGLLDADVAIAISGIAGPGGGSPDKPVGTIWLAVGNREKVLTRRIYAGKDRLKNIEYSSVHALNFVRQFLLQEQEAKIS
ncbi:MAG: CinA family protein, partial [Phaeodactylibacter sp.]|nr:CinA family protein [Phaeodactylibacter sp.]